MDTACPKQTATSSSALDADVCHFLQVLIRVGFFFAFGGGGGSVRFNPRPGPAEMRGVEGGVRV